MGINLSAQCYLRAFDHGCAIDGGWLDADALRATGLDYSLASLERLDRYVDATLASTSALDQRLVSDRAAQNTAFLLGFYAGEVLARALRRVPRWYSGEAPTGASEKVPFALRGLRGALLCEVDSAAPFAPLACLLDHLYAGAPGLAASVRACIPDAVEPDQPLAPTPADWPLGLDGARPALTADALPGLRPETPVWAGADSDEPLKRLFARVDPLLLRGRVVWGALVQANNLLFEPEFRFGAPGEVVYDPLGRCEPEALQAIARILMGFKGEGAAASDDPALQRYTAHLRDERTRLFGFALAGRLLPCPLLASSTYFDQCQLPDGMLSRGHFPLLVDVDDPGLVLPLPTALWPEPLRAEWLAAGAARVGQRFDPRAARAALVREFERRNTDPEPIFREGLRYFRGDGVPRDYQRARELWEQAAACGGGYPLALNNLGVIHEQGLGVIVDAQRQFEYYSAAAKSGLPIGQLNLGRWYLARGQVDAALPYLRQAAVAGEADARDLLRQIAGQPAEPASSGLLGRLSALFRR